MSFDIAFQRLIVVERGYSDHPSDAGGKTMWGITEAVARANGYDGAMKDLPLDRAKAIYKAQYWDTLRLDEVASVSYDVAEEMFDSGVNLGIEWPARWLQRALTALNRQGKDYPDLRPDGVVGPMTVFALKAFIAFRGAVGTTVLLRALNGQQLSRYIDVAEGRPANEDFLYGWIRNRVA